MGVRSRWIFGGKESGVGSWKSWGVGVGSRESEILKSCRDEGVGSRESEGFWGERVGSRESEKLGSRSRESSRKLGQPTPKP